MLSLKDLNYLVVLAETRHFGKAAQRCFVSQPTLSGQLKKLEQQLGVQLIERSRPDVLLTPVGEQVVARAQQMLLQGQEIENLASQHGNPFSGKIRLGLIPSLATYLLPVLVEQVRRELPDLQIELLELQTKDLLAQLQIGTADIGILALPKPHIGLSSLPMWVERFYLAVPKNHEWANHKQVQSQAIASQRLLILEDGHCLSDQTRRLCALSEASDLFKGTSLETLRHMVRMDYGVTLIPELTKQLWQQQGENGMVFLPIIDPVPGRQLGLMSRTGSAVWPVVKKLNAIAQAALPQQAAGAQVIEFD